MFIILMFFLDSRATLSQGPGSYLPPIYPPTQNIPVPMTPQNNQLTSLNCHTPPSNLTNLNSIQNDAMQNNTSMIQNNTPLMQNNAPMIQNNTPLMQNNAPMIQNNTSVVQNNTPIKEETTRMSKKRKKSDNKE